jgi:hypothetical protein
MKAQVAGTPSPCPNELTKHTHKHLFILSFTRTFLFITLNTHIILLLAHNGLHNQPRAHRGQL